LLNNTKILNNQYVLINYNDNIIDKYHYLNGKFLDLKKNNLESTFLGKIKPKDIYQECLVDALLNNENKNNNIIVIKGRAGTGKSLFSLHYCFYALEKRIIDKIIIISNPVPTRGSWRLGSLPGNKDEKLISTSIGNMLASKLGDRMMVEMLINQNQLELLPASDIRGYETKRVCLYLTEAQNYDIYMMKLVLQRVGDQTKVLIDGDPYTQVDSKDFEGVNNGMNRIGEVFRGEDIYTEIELQNIYRSKIAKIADKM